MASNSYFPSTYWWSPPLNDLVCLFLPICSFFFNNLSRALERMFLKTQNANKFTYRFRITFKHSCYHRIVIFFPRQIITSQLLNHTNTQLLKVCKAYTGNRKNVRGRVFLYVFAWLGMQSFVGEQWQSLRNLWGFFPI